MTGVGFYIHKEWRKRKQLQLSASNQRQAEKVLYDHFKDLMDSGFELSESRSAYDYNLRFTKASGIGLVMSLRPSSLLRCLIILAEEEEEARMVDINEFLEERGYKTIAPKDFRSFDDYLKELSTRIKTELLPSYKA